MLSTLALGSAAAAVAVYAREKSRRRTHPMRGGLHEEISLPHAAEYELWHNAFSLCSKKVRFCLAELGIAHASHAVDLIETGSYETLSRRFLAVNPAGLVPVLVHRGHPICESHEIIRYVAQRATTGVSLVPGDAASCGEHEKPEEQEEMDRWVHRSSLWGDDPMEHAAESAGNCVPGLTIPLFAAMIADIPVSRIAEGLLFHRLKKRPLFFLAMKVAGLRRLPALEPVVQAIDRSRHEMERHLDALEMQLAVQQQRGREWICGGGFTLADVSWAVILERLREAGWSAMLQDPRRPAVGAWWSRIRARPAYAAAMLGDNEHPFVLRGAARIAERKASDPRLRSIYGESRG